MENYEHLKDENSREPLGLCDDALSCSAPATGSALFLPNDYARCNGSGSDEDGWRDGCDVCRRRLAKRPDLVKMMAPPPIIAFECEWLIEQNDNHDRLCD